MEDPKTPNPVQPDPLLKPGAFIDPTPASNGNGKSKRDPIKPRTPSDKKTGSDKKPGSDPKPGADQKTGASADVTDEANRPDWLPPGWRFKEFLRTSGASAGTKDKYFIDPVSSRRFRSKKEVFRYLENGTTPSLKRKASDADADSMPGSNSENKRKKSEAKPKVSIENFNFDDIPGKVKWVLTDVYEGKWSPKINGVDQVPEPSKQEWSAAFTYLTLQNGGKAMF